MYTSHRKRAGYTLIELLVVIGIIALLFSIGLYSMTQSQAKARDNRRITDLKLIQGALELYTNSGNDLAAYPYPVKQVAVPNSGIYTIDTAHAFRRYLTNTPKDPSTKQEYVYFAPACISSDATSQTASVVPFTSDTLLQETNPSGCAGWVPYALQAVLERDKSGSSGTSYQDLVPEITRSVIYSSRAPLR